jgi:predicted AAA+ superfamily ATPase
MIFRTSEKYLQTLCKQFPCTVVLGPRQVGKTTLVKIFAKRLKKPITYLDMELQSDRNKLIDIELFFANNRKNIVIIDEVQLMPEIFASLRPEIDALRKPGRFILTGSASPDLVKGVSESLAGRVAYIDINPISLNEASQKKIELNKHWFRGGFPNALLAKSNDDYNRWAEYFIKSYVERDLSAIFGVGITPVLARNFWNMIAIQHGNIWNAEAMARSLGVSGPTVNRYLEFMEGAFLLRKLPAWFINAKKRMVKAPKIYIRDTGLLHFSNNVLKQINLQGHPIVGASWEGYVIEEICKLLPNKIQPYFYRTHHGAEVDLVLVNGIKPVACIEIKHSLSPVLKEGFYNCIQELKTNNNFVIYSGTEKYKKDKNVLVLSLLDFLNNYLPKLIK